MDKIKTRPLLETLLSVAIETAHPRSCLPPFLPSPPKGKVIILGAGKAALTMAEAVLNEWQGIALKGALVVPHGMGHDLEPLNVLEAAHPVPDEASMLAASHMIKLAREARKEDLVLFLISGGGSSLLALPADGVTLEEKQYITGQLLISGASIHEINCVRKHLSRIKGGRLAREAYPAKHLTLAISDVAGDDWEVIASGPTVADPSTGEQALKILERIKIETSEELKSLLTWPENESVKEDHICFKDTEKHLIATSDTALTAAKTYLDKRGIQAEILPQLSCDAQEAGKFLAEEAIRRRKRGYHGVLLSGGEVTVTQEKNTPAFNGGPNRECALSFANAISGKSGISAIMADTDGVDGKTSKSDPIAGAYVDSHSNPSALSLGLSIEDHLERHASEDLFEALDLSIRTGPTRTNVNDFRAIMIED